MSFSLPAQSAPVIVERTSEITLGETRLPLRQWTDGSVKPKAIIVTVHGAARHGGTFQTLAEHLASLGYVVLAPDLRGHGYWFYSGDKSVDKVADYDKSVDDIVALLTYLRNEHPQLPIFCMGESAGAAVAVRAAARCPGVNGLILSAMGTRPCFHDLGTVLSDVFQGVRNIDRPIDVTNVMKEYCSEDERIRHEVITDTMGRTGLSGRELIRTSWLISHTPSWAARLPEHVPVLMLQGANDEIVKASSAQDVMKRIPSTEKSFESFPCGHILLTTKYIRPDVLKSVSDWLVNKTAEQQTALLGSTTIVRK